MTNWTTAHPWVPNELVSSTFLAGMSNDLQYLYEADEVPLTITGANAAAQGMVLVQDTSADQSAAVSTTVGQAGPLWVAMRGAAVGVTLGASGRGQGLAAVQVTGSVARGDHLQTSATVGKAQTGDTNWFATALTAPAGGLVLALLRQPPPAAPVVTPLYDPHTLAVVPDLTDFTITSHIGGSDAVTQESDRIIIHLAGSLSGNEQGIFLPLPTIPFTADACIIPYVPPEYQFSLVLLENGGDKRSQMRSYWDSAAGFWKLVDAKYTNYNTFSAAGTSKSYGGPTQPIWLQVNMAGGNRAFLFGWNGQDYRTANIDTYTAAGFLPSNPTHIGITVNANGISEPGEIHLVHWHIH